MESLITMGRDGLRSDPEGPWHIAVDPMPESLCGRVWVMGCITERKRKLASPEDVRNVDGPICPECLKRAVQLAELIEALNTRVP